MLMMLMMMGMIWNAAHCTRHRDKNTLPELGEEKKSRRNGKKVGKEIYTRPVRECSLEEDTHTHTHSP